MKKRTLKSLKRELWKLVSEYVRRKEKGICFSCGKKADWKEQHCGHWSHQGRYSELAYDDDSILHTQCPSCNTFKHGNLDNYTLKMIEVYSLEAVQEFHKKSLKVHNWNEIELQLLITYYKNKLSRL